MRAESASASQRYPAGTRRRQISALWRFLCSSVLLLSACGRTGNIQPEDPEHPQERKLCAEDSLGTPATFSVCIIALSLLLVVAGCGPGVAMDRVSDAAELDWPLGRSGRDQIKLRIPYAYRPSYSGATADLSKSPKEHPNDEIYEDLLMYALWPGLKAEGDQIRHELSIPGGGRSMSALFHSAAVGDYRGRHFDSLQIAFDLAVDRSTKQLCVGPTEQPHFNRDTKAKCYPREVADNKPARFGLQRLGVDFSRYPDFPEVARFDLPADDIFYERGVDGSLQTVILCNAEEAKTVEDDPASRNVAHCQHQFISKHLNALVSINYRRVYLEDWKSIQAEWNVLIDSFIRAESRR